MNRTAPKFERYDELKDKSVLVTGGAGFIGSHLTERLAGLQQELTVFDDLSAGKLENLSDLGDKIKFIKGDIMDKGQVYDAVSGNQIVFHLAANAHVPTSVERPEFDFSTNANGTQNVLEAARKSDVERVIMASSAAVYGPPRETPMDEDHPLDPVSPYGASKLASEKLGSVYNECYDIDVCSLRIFNTYGPRQQRYVMFDFFEKLSNDPSQLEVLGTGNEVRTFIYVDNTVDAFLTLAVKSGVEGESYNVGGDSPIRIVELAELIADRFFNEETNIYTTGEAKAGDVRKLVPDLSKTQALGVSSSVPIEDGLDEFYDWYTGSH